jgi:hypothetical protein
MNGLAEIKAINDHEVLRREDEARRLKGQRPKSILGKILRKHVPITQVRASNILSNG